MDADDVKDLEKYIRDKRRAEAKSNLSEVAQLCNCIGEIYSKYGRYEDAVQEHSQERFLSETLGDKIGEAVACRKIGENLCSQGLFKEALELQKKHLIIARECGNHIEEQRAWATIGRTYLSQAETKNIQESAGASKKAEKAFVKALEACDKVKASVKPAEYMSMKGRIYLNLGLVFELRGDLKDSADMMKRAVVIAEKFKLYEELYLCHGSLASLYHKGSQFSQALRSLDVALTMAEKLRNKVWERETYIQKATVLANCADFLTAKHCLKKAHKLKVETDVSEGKLVKMFQCVNKMQEASQDLQVKTNEKELAKLYEVVADSAAELGNFIQAIENYLKVLEFSSVMSKNERADIYVSLAQSYADIRQYDNAIFYYNKELEERQDDPEQTCRTYLNIAELKELQGATYSSVCKVYLSAYEAAKKAKHTKLQIQTLKALTELQRIWKQTIHLEETQRKLTSLLQKQSLLDNSDSEEEESKELNSDADKEKAEDGNLSLSDLTVSDESDSDNGTLRAENKKKFVRRNEKGETALHRACIDGNLKKVKSLIAESHPVNPRDFCGWLPLHEACNHGHMAIVEYLIEAGAWINDRGGERCSGVTPLIDAANCGHLDIVRLLIDKGAQVMARDDDGNTALDCLRSWYSRTGDVLELADEIEYKKIEKMLQIVTGSDYNPSSEPGTSKTQPSHKSSAQKRNPAALIDSPRETDSSLLPDFLSNEVKTGSKSRAHKQQKGALNERLRKLREKRECKTASRTTQRMSEVQENLTSSDDEPADVYRNSQFLTSAGNLDLPGSEVYRLAINSVGRSSANRAEAELNSDTSNDTDTTGGKPQPSLVNAEEDVGDDWLVNDIQWPQAKRKSSAISSVLTTSSSRSTAKKRLRNDVHVKKSDQASKRHKYPLSNRDRQTARMSADESRSDDIRPRDQDKYESACAVSSTTEMVPHVDKQNQAVTSHNSEFEWDSDDDMLCQIDTVYDFGNKSSTEIASSQNDSMSSSLIVTSSPRTTREIPAGHVLQPHDDHVITTGHFQRNPSANFDGSYESGCRTAAQVLNDCDNRTLVAECRQGSVKEKFEKPTYVNSIRVKVKIGQQMLLIPIQPADQDKNISWLFQQVKERYFSMFLMLPTLTLSTQDGIMLCPADTISTVVQDNDVLTANVSAWERPKLEDRYVQACKLCLANANTNIISVLQKADQTGQLLLSDMGLGLSYLQPVFQALDDHKILTDLRLNGNRLGDAGIESLMKLLPRLPHLKILSLETNGISADGIQTMAAALKSDLCLQHLSNLSLSHNCLDDIAAEALACVVKSLPNLCHLSLCSCNFSRKLFSSSLAEALKVRRIEQLNISENNLGAEGVKDLLLGLDPACLRQLNVSHTCSTSNQEMSPHLQGFISSGACCLQELSVAGNQLSPADVTFINRLPVLVKSLRCLVLSQNQNVNNKSLQKLLYLSADKDSALSEITARGCSVTAPLESELLEAMRSKMSSSVPLNKFVFTCRGLKAGDTQLLEEIWSNIWKDQGQVKADGMTVFMTVL